ncbi:MAG: hypothetical protein RSA79_03225 [Oscillospiraceae bacterium]
MLNVSNSRFVTVFQPEIKLNVSEHIVFANLSSSKKNTDKDGNISYTYMSWNGRFVGDAFEAAKALRNGDKIDIIKGGIQNRYDKEKKMLYVDVVIFEYILSEKSTKSVEQTDEISSLTPPPESFEYEEIDTNFQ